jgi:hypothetical protein
MLAGMLAQGAAVDLRADVLTSADLRNALDVEAQKQVASCNDGASCLAEIAQALDAHVVLTGNLSSLEDEWLLQVSAYGARNASSAGRRTVRATTRKDLATAAEVAGRELIAPLLMGKSETDRLRVLVLDVNVTKPGEGAVLEVPSPYGWASVAGGSIAGLGAIAGAFAIAADIMANTPPTTVKEANSAAQARGTSLIGYVSAAVLLSAGAGIIVYDGLTQ